MGLFFKKRKTKRNSKKPIKILNLTLAVAATVSFVVSLINGIDSLFMGLVFLFAGLGFMIGAIEAQYYKDNRDEYLIDYGLGGIFLFFSYQCFYLF